MEVKLIFVYANIALALAKWDLTRVMTKQNSVDLHHPNVPVIASGETKFLEMITYSHMWIDKSLIIKEIWTQLAKVYINTSPRRWGKTMILTMIQLYHQLPLNEDGSIGDRATSANYLYFTQGEIVYTNPPTKTDEPPLISTETSLNDKHLANHPVIIIEGTMFEIKENYLQPFRVIIREIYEMHQSLLRHLNNKLLNCSSESEKSEIVKDIQKFQKYYNETLINNASEEELSVSIRTLTKLLGKTYDSTVIILFDEYDGFIVNTYFKQNPTGILPSDETFQAALFFIKQFMMYTFKLNGYLGKGIITGILPIRETTGLSGLNNVHLKYVFGANDFFPFYGIFSEEFYDMANKRGTDKSLLNSAVARYDGYHTLSHLDVPMYSTYSTIGFINSRVVQNYWTETSLALPFIRLFAHDGFISNIASIIRKWRRNEVIFDIAYEQIISLTIDDFKIIYNLVTKQIDYNSDMHQPVVLSFLLSLGYLSVSPQQPGSTSTKDHTTVAVTIPNDEIYNVMRYKYIKSLPLDLTNIKVGDPALKNFMEHDDSSTLYPLAKSISNYLINILQNNPFSKVSSTAKFLSQSFNGRIYGNEKMAESLVIGYFFKLMASNRYDLEKNLNPKIYQILEQHKFTDKDYGQQILDIFFTDHCETCALIMELKYVERETEKNSILAAFKQCLRYVLFYRKFGEFDAPSAKFLAGRIHKNATIELMSFTMRSEEVKICVREAKIFADDLFTKYGNMTNEERRIRWADEMYNSVNKSRIFYSKHDPKCSPFDELS